MSTITFEQLQTLGPDNYRLARRIARKHWIRSRGDAQKAIEAATAEINEAGIDPGTIILIIQIIVMLIKWWMNRKIRRPSMEPVSGEPGFEILQESMWGDPPRRTIRNAWNRGYYGDVGELGPRDFASIGTNYLCAQSIILPMSTAVETLAETAIPTAPRGAFFTGAFLGQSIVYIAMKVIAAVLRQYGESMARDFFAWVWEIISSAFWSVWPFGRDARKRRREKRREERKKRPGFFRRLFGRRVRKKESKDAGDAG